jgi:uncharacterized metal-binding protein YceD (DUF177 family)
MSPSVEGSSPGFSYPVALGDLAPEGRRFGLEAGADALASIARRLAVPAVARLKGLFEVTPTAEGARLVGAIDAELVRECVISLEPMNETVNERFEIRFAHNAGAASPGSDILIDDDSPEPLEGDSLDLGEILVQQLALGMAPYPRKPGAKPLADAFGSDAKISPFDRLKEAFADRGGQE